VAKLQKPKMFGFSDFCVPLQGLEGILWIKRKYCKKLMQIWGVSGMTKMVAATCMTLMPTWM
jgi:hypothetical protein